MDDFVDGVCLLCVLCGLAGEGSRNEVKRCYTNFILTLSFMFVGPYTMDGKNNSFQIFLEVW